MHAAGTLQDPPCITLCITLCITTCMMPATNACCRDPVGPKGIQVRDSAGSNGTLRGRGVPIMHAAGTLRDLSCITLCITLCMMLCITSCITICITLYITICITTCIMPVTNACCRDPAGPKGIQLYMLPGPCRIQWDPAGGGEVPVMHAAGTLQDLVCITLCIKLCMPLCITSCITICITFYITICITHV